nr:replication protein A 70 kDa DNA-binding subunit B [Tanacetum cinerariifolium]
MTQLCDVGPMLDDLKVLARCISIWKPHRANKPNEVWSLEMVFQDAQENKKDLELLKTTIAKARYSRNVILFCGMDVASSGLYEDKGKTYDLNFEKELLNSRLMWRWRQSSRANQGRRRKGKKKRRLKKVALEIWLLQATFFGKNPKPPKLTDPAGTDAKGLFGLAFLHANRSYMRLLRKVYEKAEEIFEKLQETGIEPDVYAYNALMEAYSF